MLKKTITYVDYNDVERTEDFYFNLSKAEAMEMEMSAEGGLSQVLEQITKEMDTQRLVEMFKSIILMSYGQKSPDGKYFVKNEDVRNAFVYSEAYSVLFMELATDEAAAAAFVNGIATWTRDQDKPAPVPAIDKES